jgi:hypothetical protein
MSPHSSPLLAVFSFVLPTLMFTANAPVRADDATLDLDALIKGLDGSDVWRTQKSWMVRYTNSRTRVHPPPKAMVEWPDAEVVNARKGDWLFAHVRQPHVGRPDAALDHWMLWRGRKFTERIGDSVQTGDNPKQMASYFWYPNSLMREGLVELLGVPKIAYLVDPELSVVLPWCLRANKSAYRVRKQLEEIDGAMCHVVERPDRDILWIDTKRGFQVRRRTLFQKSGQPLAEFRATDFRERATDVWLPTRQLAAAYNFDRDPPEYRGRLRFVLTNTLSEVRFGELPDTLFAVPERKKR